MTDLWQGYGRQEETHLLVAADTRSRCVRGGCTVSEVIAPEETALW
jgi:hypothetical protein